jgi:uncharacterized protein (TIGR04222 family)
MYQSTLAAYRGVFGVDASEAIWPADGRRIEAATASPGWTVPVALRAGANLAFAVVLGAAAVGLLLRLSGALDVLQDIGPLAFLGIATLATLVLAFLGFSRPQPAATPDGRDVLEPYEVAWLSGGLERMAMTAVVTLIERGVLLPPGPSPQRGPRPPIPVDRTVVARAMHPVEAACLSAATDEGLRFSAACAATAPVAAAFRHRLVAAGQASGADVLPRRRALALAGLSVLFVIEFERLFHAQGTHQRVGFLFMLTLVQVLLTAVFVKRTQRASPRAEAVLRPLRLSAGRYKKTPPVGPALAFGVALAGGAALADDLRFDGLGQQVNAVAAARRAAGNGGGGDDLSCSSCGSDGGSGGDGGGSSCSSGCGGSGCGGGGD